MSVYRPYDGRITLCVQLLGDGTFGVYANAVLIAIHPDEAAADAHCKRLRNQQAQE